ncbi:hypothetical protein [Acetobacterium wieringae]|uniref:hypothetical protein n=1 Tax=Acetobacterium wieringae TaxID=52694 RepID=UPI0026F349E6|nr:hypothetical protein [Acetobacterium wieringae]
MYNLKNNYVLRDIGGIYFLIDTFEESYFKGKKLISINSTGKTIIEIIQTKPGINLKEVFNAYLRVLNINNETDELRAQIEADLEDYIKNLINQSILEYEVKEDENRY